MHLLEMAFAMMKQIPLIVGLIDLIVVHQMLLISTVQNALVTVGVFINFHGFWAKKLT